MMNLLLSWFLYAAALIVVGKLLPGIRVKSYGSALIAVVVIAIMQIFPGYLLQFLALPVTFLTFGLFALVINAFLFWVAGALLKGFDVKGGLPAFVGSIVYTLLVLLIRHFLAA